jgi:hypothetical protein
MHSIDFKVEFKILSLTHNQELVFDVTVKLLIQVIDKIAADV